MKPKDAIANARSEGRSYLTEIESKEILDSLGIDTARAVLATSKKEAQAVSKKLGYPAVLKIVSPDIVHKSDVGGVKLNLESASAVAKAYSEIMASVKKNEPKARVDGVAVQKMAEPGVEVIVGMSTDSTFGPVIMFGLGGVMVEVMKDVSFRIVPLLRRDAREMVREIKGYQLLNGYRGSDPVDKKRLEDIILKVSNFVNKHPEVKEMDLNPIYAYKDGAIAVDARIILNSKS
jgi:acyl-CoA synthetase (NDP forming)